MGALALGLVAGLGLVGVIKPGAIRWLFVGATVMVFPIGWVTTQIALALMLYLVLTPVALVFRLRKRDALQLSRRPGQTSFWRTRAEMPKPEQYLKQF